MNGLSLFSGIGGLDVALRVDRIKCLGNSVVSQQAKEAFKILMGLRVEK